MLFDQSVRPDQSAAWGGWASAALGFYYVRGSVSNFGFWCRFMIWCFEINASTQRKVECGAFSVSTNLYFYCGSAVLDNTLCKECWETERCGVRRITSQSWTHFIARTRCAPLSASALWSETILHSNNRASLLLQEKEISVWFDPPGKLMILNLFIYVNSLVWDLNPGPSVYKPHALKITFTLREKFSLYIISQNPLEFGGWLFISLCKLFVYSVAEF